MDLQNFDCGGIGEGGNKSSSNKTNSNIDARSHSAAVSESEQERKTSSLSSNNGEAPSAAAVSSSSSLSREGFQSNGGNDSNGGSINGSSDDLVSPSIVDDMLLRKLMGLSARDRNAIHEEIHGVRSMAPLETPQILNTALQLLALELDQIIPNDQKAAYLIARNMGLRSYVNTTEFRLRMLRSCCLDARAAARKTCVYLNQLLSIFGESALEREIQLHRNFTKDEIREFRKGRYQLLPYRDRSGRRILVVFPDQELERMNTQLRHKFVTYLGIVAVKNDTETQKSGLVVLVWFEPNYKISFKPPVSRLEKSQSLTDYIGCVRVSAIHICTPDTPAYRFRRSLVVVRAGNTELLRLKFHEGEPVELRYELQSFGIPTDTIPMTWSGTVKTVYHKNWMKLRRAVEDSCYKNTASSEMEEVVECPNSNDVLFRQGTSIYAHPGNARFRSLVEQKVVARNLLSLASSSVEDSEASDQAYRFDPYFVTTADLITDVIDEILDKNKGRVLVWDANHNRENYDCWCTLTNTAQIYSKIEYIVREFLRGSTKRVIQKCNQQAIDSSTSIFRASKQSRTSPLLEIVTSSSSPVHFPEAATTDGGENDSNELPKKRCKLTSDDDDSNCMCIDSWK